MDLLNPVLKPVRTLLREESPLHNLESIETRILATGEAIKGATESIEGHVAVLESLTNTLNETLPALNATLATTLPALVAAVEDLATKLGVVSEVLAPVVRAEADLGKVSHLLGHHHHDDPAAAPAPETPQP
jgi:ABC-type transporter Mla subunit MlaD